MVRVFIICILALFCSCNMNVKNKQEMVGDLKEYAKENLNLEVDEGKVEEFLNQYPKEKQGNYLEAFSAFYDDYKKIDAYKGTDEEKQVYAKGLEDKLRSRFSNLNLTEGDMKKFVDGFSKFLNPAGAAEGGGMGLPIGDDIMGMLPDGATKLLKGMSNVGA
ncbi:hypothetical protein CR532_04710 (plasmid) [Candidatus Borreliella tachyglossi]|uniref:Uncharacterized protein n=1 Tax=Candidatus Borreliella tachyglossi TaxID=1964448 RepID=A0A2S1LYE4_9SPIR|nr:hypothetical protein [Candidatus Borreliella tachyglossi]AWG43302.1 hypothetical protein CR532_04710 [Candidatus Borreliella tachyglossi]